MKKIILIFLLIVTCKKETKIQIPELRAGTLRIIQDCTLRSEFEDRTKDTIITTLNKGEVYNIEKTFSYWLKVKVLHGESSYKEGYMYYKVFRESEGIIRTVCCQGARLRKNPEVKKGNEIGFIKPNIMVRIIDFNVDWYRIKRNPSSLWKAGWVHRDYVEARYEN